ncbi:MAG: signal peptidase II [Pseudomonadales bacterium]|nr:signal peptidase II [Pseudomonadales bacterium]
MTSRFNSRTVGFFLLAVLILILDQATKYFFDNSLVYGETHPVVQGFDLLLVYNTGAAFSFLSDAGGWQRWILTGVSLVISLILLVWLTRLQQHERLLGVAIALILGGALGNLVDRVLMGYVIDFISIYFQQYRFATFNIADSAISIGALLMALDIIRGKEAAK